MAGNNVINYDIKFNADTSNITSQVNQLKSTLKELGSISFEGFKAMNVGEDTAKLRQEYNQLQTTIQAVDTALTQAFNKDLGTLNVAKFNQSINSSVGGIQNVGNALNSVGVKGQQAFKKLATELLTVNHQLRQSGGFLASMAQTMANTIKWGVASSVMNNFTGTVKKAYGYVKHLDSSLNDIRIVTGKSSDEMDKFAVKANKAAQSLGQSTNAYTEAALIYYQQGLGDVDVEARANVTLKAANVTGQTGAEVSEQLTAVWNGYKVSAEESELYIDKLAAVAANSASNLEELSTGMSKVASAANAMGVDVDQLNAQLSTIIAVTRQAPESVGTALKTIYARMSDLKLGETDEEGIGLGDVSGTMESMGIDVLDTSGNLRDMGDVIEDVAKKWDTWTEAQKTAMAQAMAGKRQYNNLVALFENWDMYEKSKGISEGSAGELQRQQDTYMESTAAHLKQLKAEWEDLYDSLMDPKQINGVVDGLTKIVNLMGAWVDGVGGGVNILAMLGSVAMNVFSRQIATSLTNTILKFQTSKQMAADLRAEMELTKQIDTTKSNSSDLRVLIDMKKQQLAVTQAMTQQEYELVNKMIEEKSILQDQAVELKNKLNNAQTYYKGTSHYQPNKPLTEKNEYEAGNQLIADSTRVTNQSNKISKDVEESVDQLALAYGRLKDAKLGAASSEDIANAQKNVEVSFTHAKKAVEEAIVKMEDWKQSGKVQGAEATKLQGIIDTLKNTKMQDAASTKKVADAMSDGAEIGKKAGIVLNKYGLDLQKVRAEIDKNAQAADRLNQKWSSFFQEMNLRAQVQNFSIMISKTGQLFSALNMLVNMPSIFKDESLSAGEKFLRIGMSITTMVPLIISSVTGLSTTFHALTTSLRSSIAMTELKQILDKKALTTTSLLNAKKLASIGINANMTKVEMLEAIASKFGITVDKEKNQTLTTGLLLEKIKAKLDHEGMSRTKRKIAIKFLELMKRKEENASISTTIALLIREQLVRATHNIYIMAGVAAITLLLAVTSAYLSAEKEKEERLKKANDQLAKSTEIAKDLQNQYNELTSAVNKFKESISNYQDGVEALKKLDVTTVEYKDKLKELNKEAKGLLETFNLWDNYTYENGLITFKQEDIDNITLQKEAMALEAERRMYGGNISLRIAETEIPAAEVANALGKTSVVNVVYEGGLQEIEMTKEGLEGLTEAFYTTQEEFKKESKNFDIDNEEFQQKFVENAENLLDENQFALLTNHLSLVNDGMNDDVLPALQKYINSLEEAKNANLNYAKEILAINVKEEYGKDILEAARRPDGTIDYELAAIFEQATSGLFENYSEGNIPQQITEKRADIATTLETKIKNHDNLNQDGFAVSYLVNLMGQETFSKILEEQFGMEYTGQTLDTTTMGTAYFKKLGYENVSITDPNDGKGTLEVAYTTSDAEGSITEHSQSFTNQLIASRVLNIIADQYLEQLERELMQSALQSGIGGYDAVRPLYDDIKNNIGQSGFGASAVQMQQIYADALKNNNFDLQGVFSTISETEKQAMLGMNPQQLQEYLNLPAELIAILENNTGKTLLDMVKASLSKYTEQDAYAAANTQGETLAEKYELDIEVFKKYRDSIKEANAELNPDEVNERAIADMRMEKGVESLSGKWKDYKKTLEDVKSTTYELDKAQVELAPHLKDILNFTDEEFELLPDDFAKDNVKKINDVMNGVEGSVGKLRAEANKYKKDAFGDEYILTISPEIKKDTEIWNELQNLQDQILSYNTAGFEIGVALKEEDQAELYAAFNNIVEKAGWTADEATKYFKELGYDVVVESKYQIIDDYIEYPVGDFFANVAGGNPAASNYSNLKTVKLPTPKKVTGVSMKVITPNGSYGGGVGFNNTPSPSSTSNKGGGGDNKPEKIEAFESEVDRYHDVENELKKLNTLLERQERIASKLTGKDRIAAIQKQISLLQEQNEKQKEKLKLMQEEAAELKKKLQGEGVKFDAEGDISNYKALLQAKEDEINKMIDEANSKSSKDAQEKIKEDIENAKEEYEKLKEWIERYETLMYDEMPGLEDEMQEAWDKQIELQIEAFEIEIKLKLDLQDTKRQLNEFMREVIEGIEDDEYGKIQEYIAKDLPTYFGETGTAQANYDALQKALKEYQTIKNGGIGEIFGDDANAAWEKVMELKDETLDSLSEVKDLIDEMEENYLNAIEAASEEFAKHLEQYEQIQSILDHNIKLIEMLAGDEAYDAQLAYYNQMERKNLGQVDEARRILEFWRQQKAAAEEGSEAWKEANAKEQEAQEQLNALVEQSVETIKTKYEKTVSKIIKDLNNAVTSGKGLDALSQEWELINQEADMYLDTVNSAYEIQKLENKLIDAIDNASSLKAKQRLNELMEKELGMLKDKDKLSQYEVDRANQLLDIEMKKIALEEAQRNKSQMRLRRDSQGNYSYQYVTDNDAVAKAQEELNEAQNSLFNLDKDAYKENLDQILSLWTDFQTKLNEIWTNNNLTDEQKQQQAYELRERYMRMISGLTQDNENIRLNLEVSTFSELARLRNMDIQDFQNMADEQKKILLEQVIPQWSSGLQSLAEQFKDENGFTSLMNQAFKDLQTNLANYQKSLKDLEKNAGIKFEKIISGAEDYSKEIQNLINQNKTIVDDQAEILKGIRDSIDATKEWVEEFNKLAEAAKETLDTIVQIQEEENKKDTSNANNNSQNNKSEDKKDSSSNKDSSSSSSKSSSGGDGKLTTGETVTYVGGPYYETSAGGGKSGSRGPGKKVTVTRISKGEKYPIHVESGDSAFGWLKEDQLTGYGTGGYTGDWSSRDGRLAVLHEKELVLNKQDTKNILAAVDMVRSLNNSLTSRMANLFNHSSVDKLIQLFEKDSAPLEQNVQITASFPNVSVEREIEEAFNSLISSASQYAFNTLK